MRRKMKKMTALILAGAMILGGCSVSKTSGEADTADSAAETTAALGESETAAAETTAGDQKAAVYLPENFKSDKPESEWKIAVVPQWGAAPWWVRGNEGTKQFASETGINAYEVSPAEQDVAAQIQVVEDLISQNVDAICICMIDPSAMEPILQKALDKGIVVISHEAASAQNVLFDLEAFSNADYGAKLMDLLAEAMGEEGKYATMVGNLTKVSHMVWTEAEVNQAKTKYPKMELVNDTNPSMESGDTNDGAYEAVKEFLTANPDVGGILTCGSTEPMGVARALDELGIAGKVKLVGTGMPSECRELIENGSMTAMCVWDPAAACYAMCNLSAKILRGETLDLEAGIDLGQDGWTQMKPLDGNEKVLAGQGWLVYDKTNIADGEF